MFQFSDINIVQNHLILNQTITQINKLLQNNLNMISKLEKRIFNLVELNQKIDFQLGIINLGKPKCELLQQSPPQQKIIQKIFFKKDYMYFLSLKNHLKTPLFKDRNFNLSIGLYDSDHNLIANRNNIPLQIVIYNASENLQIIEYNKIGYPILKGNTSADLVQGHANFQKISIRQVSSKFEKGLVHILIFVKAPPFEKIQDEVDYRQIRPLIIKDVMIRAKKI